MKYLFLILLSGAVYASQLQIYELNASQLPANVTLQINVTVPVNESVSIVRVDSTQNISAVFTSLIDYNGSENVSVDVNVSIDNLSIANLTTLTVVLNASSNMTNVSDSYSLLFAISPNADPEWSIVFTTVAPVINVTSNLLPFKGSFPINVTGLSGRSYTAACTGILTCDEQGVFDSSNASTFTVNYKIPLDQKEGSYSFNVTVVSGNKSRTLAVPIVVSEPSVEQLAYVFRDDCFVEVPGQNFSAVKYECLLEQEEFNIRRLTQMLDRLRAIRNASEEAACVPKNVTQYVVAGQIDQDVYNQYTTCNQERSLMTNQLSDTASKLTSLQGNYDDVRAKMLANESTALLEAFEYKKQADADAKRYKETWRTYYNKRFWKWTGWQWGVTILIIATALYVAHYRRESWGGFG